MTRQRRYRPCLSILPILTCIAPAICPTHAADRPNIVFMLSDDQSWNGLSVPMHPDLEASRSPINQTPWLAKLATQGMRFSAAYAPAPVCSPTRCSLQTGKTPARNHWTKAGPSMTAADNYPLLPPVSIRRIPFTEITVGEALRTAGYATAHFGKWHLAGGGPEQHGYGVSDGNLGNEHAYKFTDPNPVDIFGMAERANEFMKQNVEAERPFFMQLSWHALHAPENALAATRAKYQEIGDRHRPSAGLHCRKTSIRVWGVSCRRSTSLASPKARL